MESSLRACLTPVSRTPRLCERYSAHQTNDTWPASIVGRLPRGGALHVRGNLYFLILVLPTLIRRRVGVRGGYDLRPGYLALRAYRTDRGGVSRFETCPHVRVFISRHVPVASSCWACLSMLRRERLSGCVRGPAYETADSHSRIMTSPRSLATGLRHQSVMLAARVGMELLRRSGHVEAQTSATSEYCDGTRLRPRDRTSRLHMRVLQRSRGAAPSPQSERADHRMYSREL
jgi:hypothetical protein